MFIYKLSGDVSKDWIDPIYSIISKTALSKLINLRESNFTVNFVTGASLSVRVRVR
ncbi:hypothetical protein FACS1894105_04050 [Clostridia bacterium]|nr:hypothetical protein FACS1894105_04050 [Clostridia bacterium]